MKKVLSILLCFIMLLSSVNFAFAEEFEFDDESWDQKHYTVNLDLNQKSPFGAFHGWGTSICWWGHHLGENLTDEQLDSVVKALYDEKEGLGLNIARYNIGGGDDPEHHHQREFDGRDMPGLTDKDGKWNLANDQGQLKALQLTVKYGADILEAFSNSPPYYMTESGCSSGNHNSGENNLPDENFDDFAEYLAEAVYRIQKEYGVKFDTLEPFNESDTNYWGYEGWQEGCHFDVEDHSKLILMVRNELNKRGLTYVGVAAADETNVWRTGENIKNVYTDEAIAALSQVNTHSYSVGDYNHTRNAVLEANKPLYMTEVDGDGSIGGEASGSMGPALWFANKINEDLRGLEPNAWVMWQAAAMAYKGEHKDSGYWNIMSIDQETGELHLPKKYYTYKQFTKFIRPGDTLVKTDYNNIIAAVNEEEGKVVFVITNADSATKNYDLSVENLGMQIKHVECYVTDQNNDCANVDLGIVNDFARDKGIYYAQIPPYSVATVVFNGKMQGNSIKLTEKNNTATVFVGEELELTVTDENGNDVDAEFSIESGCNCLPKHKITGNKIVFNEAHEWISIVAKKDGLKANYPINIIDNGSTVRIIGSGSERALKPSGNDVVIADRDNANSQEWVIENQGEYYSFKNEKTGKYLSTESFLTTSTNLNDNALWKLEKDKGLYRIINKANEESIDVYNHATHNGAQVGVYGGYYATPNQLFYFEAPGYGSFVEVEYVASEFELTGTPFGSEPWDGDENVTFDKAWDGDKETFFHAGRNDDRTGYTAIDLGEKHMPFNKVTINSRPGFEYRGWEAVLSGSNEKDGEYTVIHKFTEEDFKRGEYASVDLGEYVNYRYVKYETPNGGYTNVGEVNLIYAPEKPNCEYIGDNLLLGGGKMYIISYYEGDVLKKVETTTAETYAVNEPKMATSYSIRVHVLGSENNLLATFFVKRY